ncbi:MAG: cyclic nucleotide-binding domain-containing protein [Anaerolineae bacterium]
MVGTGVHMAHNAVNQLRQTKLFSKLDRDDLAAVAQLTQEEHHPVGCLIYRQGERGHRWYLVKSGALRVLRVDPDGVERQVNRFAPGDSFGESSLLLGEPHDATVVVVEDAILVYINKTAFDQLLAERPSILNDLQMDPKVRQRRRAPRFDWQEPDEAVVFVLHKHNVILVRRLILPGALLLLILAGFFVIGSGRTVSLIIGGLLAAGPLLFALYRVIDHFNDNYILTNKRVMHDEQIYLIRQSRVGAPLSNVQSVQEVQEGLLAQAFDFGDLRIETAGEPVGTMLFRQIPDPAGAQAQIFEQKERIEAQARAEERASIQGVLRRRFGQSASDECPPEHEEKKETSEEDHPSSIPSVLIAPLRFVRYFLPPLRYEEGDTITWRKHWVALLRPIGLPTGLIILATAIAALLLASGQLEQTSVLVVYVTVLMFLVPWWLWVFEDWQNDIYQVTSARIVDIEQLPFALREERREASLGQIQNVNLMVPGVVGRLLGYGSVTIETAGAGAFTFDYVKKPRDVQAEIFRRMDAFKRREREKEAKRRQDELLDWFSVYDQMRHPEADQGASGPVFPTAPQRG